MNNELKKAIVNYMLDNHGLYQIVAETVKNFRQYIYTENGDYCYGGKVVYNFISSFDRLSHV